MTKQEYFEFQKRFFDKAIELTAKKNADYTGTGGDPFANFKRIGQTEPSWVLIGFLTRMTDKFARLESYVQRGELMVKDESVEDTLLDLANYSALLAGYITSLKPYPANHDFREEVTAKIVLPEIPSARL